MTDSVASCFILLVASVVVFVLAALTYMKAVQERIRSQGEVRYARRTKEVGLRLRESSDAAWRDLQDRQTLFWKEFGREFGKATGKAFPKMPEIPGAGPPPRGEA